MTDKDAVFLRQATSDDIEALEQLLNRCYRQSEGWTNEADLVGGIRTTSAELSKVIADPRHYFFVYPKTDTGHRDGIESGALLGCIAVDMQNSKDVRQAYIGMFAVDPDLQGAGIGNVILQAVETFAERHLLNTPASNDEPSSDHSNRLTMSILNHRPELLAYYERRGYQLTGKTAPFPVDGNNGEPKREDLQLLELEKVIKH